MNNLLLVAFLTFLVFLPVGSSADISQTQTQKIPSPDETVKAFLSALTNADLDGIVAAFAEDGTLFLPFPSPVARLTGQNEIRKAFVAFFERLRPSRNGPPYLTLNPQDKLIQEFDATAIVTFHLGKLPDG